MATLGQLAEQGTAVVTLHRMQAAFRELRKSYTHKGIEHIAITGKIEGTRSRGRQRTAFIENLKSWAIGKGSNNNFIRPLQATTIWLLSIAPGTRHQAPVRENTKPLYGQAQVSIEDPGVGLELLEAGQV
ncbi:hypothetical protein PoB_004714500 [Plakobranchus ocellatus]|uniref:Uncharacterized protein n=1 Tax=Plakobranchus ocellatus TaxID=259542 RepID=A0AAV4BNG8_9GAST|nr:hypothetical protein PoB_004714500 [Plakobranchus ocellatus]